MNKFAKRIAAITVFALLVGLFTPVPAVGAATSQTMYVGEVFEHCIYGTTITSVSSSNKKVVKTAKVKTKNYACTLDAKKSGSATVTIKYKDYRNKSHTKKLKVTVKKLDIKASIQPLDSGYGLLVVENNTKQTFDRVSVLYTLKDSSGAMVREATEVVHYVMAGKTTYDLVYVGKDLGDVDYAQSTAKVLNDEQRDPNYTYKNITKKDLVVTEKDKVNDGSFIKYKLTMQNKLNKSVTLVHYFISYDAQGNITYLDRYSEYLTKKETKTKDYQVSIGTYSHPNFDHCVLVTQAYSTEKKK